MKQFRYEIVLLLLLVALLGLAGWLMPSFLKPRGQLLLSKHLWGTAILAVAMTPIVITGGIDLSVGSAMGLCAVAFGLCFEHTESIPLSCLACVSIGILGGATNGGLIAKWNIHPLIITLATYAGFRGIAEGVSQGMSYSQFGDRFGQLSRNTLFHVPVPAYLFAFFAVVTAVWLAKSPSGRFVYAIGHNETAARFSGVAVGRLKFWLYTYSGFLASMATLIDISLFDTAKADAGTNLELDVITAVVVGGTSIFGGRGNLLGTLLGLLLIHESKLFVGRYLRIDELKSIVVGCLLIGSLLVNNLVAQFGKRS